MHKLSPFNPPQPTGISAVDAASAQTLWHLAKGGLPGITAVLTQNGDAFELDVVYGNVAQQRLVFACPLPAAARAEALREGLEAAGYHKKRRDKRGVASR